MIPHFKKSARQLVSHCKEQLTELSPLDIKRKIIQEASICFQAQLEQLLPLFIQHFEAHLDSQLESLSLFSETCEQQSNLGSALHEFEKHKRDWKSEQDLARGLQKLSTFYSYYVGEKKELQRKLDLKTEVELRWDSNIISHFIRSIVQLSVRREGVELIEPKPDMVGGNLREPALPTDEELGRFRAEKEEMHPPVSELISVPSHLEDLQRENDFLKMKIDKMLEEQLMDRKNKAAVSEEDDIPLLEEEEDEDIPVLEEENQEEMEEQEIEEGVGEIE